MSLDFIAVSLVFVLLFVVLVGGASDKARLSGFGVSTSICEDTKASTDVVDIGNRMMPGVTWTTTALCRVTSFGLAQDRFVQLARIESPTENVTTTQAVSVPVDASGGPVSPFYLDWLGYLLFAATYLAFVISHWQATPAMRLLGIKLVGHNGGRAGFKRAILRMLYACVPIVVIFAVVFGGVWLINQPFVSTWLLVPTVLISLLVPFFWWRPFSLRPSLPRAPLHDIWAGTRIIRPAVDMLASSNA